jgi:hypothetical protein
VLHVADAPLLFGPKAVLDLLELPETPRFLATAALERLELGQPLARSSRQQITMAVCPSLAAAG